MNDLILLNYNLNIDKIIKIKDDEYSFYDGYNKYYFVKVTRPIKDIYEINRLLSVNSNYHTIVMNNNNNIITIYNSKNFVLLKLKFSEHIEIDMMDILSNYLIRDSSILDRTNYSKLWEAKIDYLEYQVSELGKNHKLILESFSYFTGLGENAIEYFNDLEIKNVPKVVSHRRIFYPNNSLNFFNPLECVVDYRIRDLAEYTKSGFFNDYNAFYEIENILNKGLLSNLEWNLFFVRLLYPSNYFDDVCNVLERKYDDNIILKYINRVNEYEIFLNRVYKLIHKKIPLLRINWLIK